MITTDQPTPCQDNPDPFDAVLEGNAPHEADVEAAKAVCKGCPVTAECLRHGRAVKAMGVFGGRLIGLKVRGSQEQPKERPTCVRCGDARARRIDGSGWTGSNGMCDRCYQADWRASHGMEPQPWKRHRREPADPVRVERAICGEAVMLSISEREAAVELLAGRGLSDPQISFLLRLHKDSVTRIRRRTDVAAGTAT